MQQHGWTWRLSYEVKLVRERQISHDIIYMWNLKYDANEFIKQKQTHRHRKQTYDYQRGKGGGRNYEFGISRYTIHKIDQQQWSTV